MQILMGSKMSLKKVLSPVSQLGAPKILIEDFQEDSNSVPTVSWLH